MLASRLLLRFISIAFAPLLITSAAVGQQRNLREQVARAYQDLERIAVERMDDAEAWQFANRALDASVESYFLGRLDDTLRQLTAAVLELELNRPPAPHELAWLQTSATITPDVLQPGEQATVTISMRSPNAAHDEGVVRSELVVRDAHRLVLARHAVAWERADDREMLGACEVAIQTPSEPQTLSVELIAGDLSRTIFRLPVLSEEPDTLRARLIQRLDAAAAKSDGSVQDVIATCRARLGLLRNRPVPARSASFLVDIPAIAGELEAEVAAIEAGQHPYVGSAGSHWHMMQRHSIDLPFWIHVPEQRSDDARDPVPMPVVIALHGAGGDESLFMYGYGNGLLRELADAHGFIIISPLAFPLAPYPDLVHELVDFAAAVHPINRDRVHLIGHSLGVMIMSSIVNRSPDSFASAVGIAGTLSYRSDVQSPPTLIFAGGMDRVIPAERIARSAETKQSTDTTVVYRLIQDSGHTLIVPRVLPDAIEWMLSAHERADR